jgi:CRP-like cAMP-binding protein
MNESSASAPPAARNKLLAALPPEERILVEQNSIAVPMKRREVLYRADEQIRYVYFIVDGIASLMSVMSEGGVETATIGREGMVGMAAFHGVYSTPEQAMVQVAGTAYRMDVDTFRELLPQLPTLECLLHRFSVVLFTLAAQNSGCNRKHSIEARCARWLLMVADRLDIGVMELTHDFVAQMLGVRRASVTETLGELERQGLIQTSRGRIRIVEREGLQRVACDCYSVIRGVVNRLLESNDGQYPTSPRMQLASQGAPERV